MDSLTLPAPMRSAIPPAAKPVTITRGAILDLDPDTPACWALRPTMGPIVSGPLSPTPSRHDGGGMRFRHFRRWLEQPDVDAGPTAPRGGVR